MPVCVTEVGLKDGDSLLKYQTVNTQDTVLVLQIKEGIYSFRFIN